MHFRHEVVTLPCLWLTPAMARAAIGRNGDPEALHAGPHGDGERDAAANAAARSTSVTKS
jgi:hypothetical protein